MQSVELFTGAGGLALGLEQAGFSSALMVEWDHDACGTVRANAGRRGPTEGWPLQEIDVREVDFRPLAEKVELLAGGPPCQPFSIGGKHLGPSDPRDMWPQAIRAVKELRPKTFLFENVRGLARSAFAPYLRYILARLKHPDMQRRAKETPERHLARLERASSPMYDVEIHQVNAADFGAAQKRHRVVIVGTRSDLGIRWQFPERTHSRQMLVRDKWVTGAYWRRHGIAVPDRKQIDLAELREANGLFDPAAKPWRTVRDAIGNLPSIDSDSSVIANHRFQPGARAYVGHTGSVLDEPAKALKAGDHGVPGGENMLANADGTVRYFTVRECARLQGFPDNYVFPGSWGENMRQLGNAVPVELAIALAASAWEALKGNTRRRAA